MEFNHSILGQNIAMYRNSNNLSQKELANLLNISASIVSRIECATEKTSINLLFKISEILNVTVDSLISSYLLYQNDKLVQFDKKDKIRLEFHELLVYSTIRQRVKFLEILNNYLDIRKNF